ncbi:hypothetical protein BGX21_007314, partial [Mortierella sp. AD011]
MKFLAATIALVAAAVVNACEDQPAQSIWTNYATEPDFNITNMTIDPNPFCVGENACGTIVGSLLAPITAPSTLTLMGTYFGVTLYSYSADFCTLVSCPVAQSTTTLEYCFPILSTFPAGLSLDLDLSVTNGNGNTLFWQKTTSSMKFVN